MDSVILMVLVFFSPVVPVEIIEVHYGDRTGSNFMNELNQLRKLHNARPLEWSSQLFPDCRAHAIEMAAADKQFHTIPTEWSYSYTENTCVSYNPLACIMIWYDEIKNYDFDNPDSPKAFESLSDFGHFTALVWNYSRIFAFEYYRGVDRKYYASARFSPSGNHLTEFKLNVFPSTGEGNEISMLSMRHYSLLIISFLIISLAGFI